MKGYGGLVLFGGFVAFAVFVVNLYGSMAAPAASHSEHEGGSGSHSIGELPENWNGYQRTDTARGASAVAEIDRLHGKSIEVLDGYRAQYVKSGQDQFTVWIAMTRSEAEALSMVEQMTKAIGSGNQMFSQPVPVTMSGYQAYQSQAMGQTHFYYAKGDAVYWVAVPNAGARELAAKIAVGL